MNLFSSIQGEPENLLPADGIVRYYGVILSRSEADHYYQMLLTGVEWKHDEAVILGKHIITPRKVAWYGDEPFRYTYSGITKTALPWTVELSALQQIATAHSGATFNSCLLNLYHNGQEGMAWHSDGETTLLQNGVIASLSFGAARKFSFKHKHTRETVSLVLEHGSLLVMAGTTQTYWWHRLPPTKKVTSPRINLTFRTIALP